jgi:hypothetical protein
MADLFNIDLVLINDHSERFWHTEEYIYEMPCMATILNKRPQPVESDCMCFRNAMAGY